jgi:pentatricopeptide repeat protein
VEPLHHLELGELLMQQIHHHQVAYLLCQGQGARHRAKGVMYITTKLLIFYAKIKELGIAQKVFDRIPERSVVAWNTMISRCARRGEEARAVELFNAMCVDGLWLDQFMFTSVLCACMRPTGACTASHSSQTWAGTSSPIACSWTCTSSAAVLRTRTERSR